MITRYLLGLILQSFFVDREEKKSSHDLNREIIIFCVQRDACGTKFCICSEIYESETQEVQVDGSLHL